MSLTPKKLGVAVLLVAAQVLAQNTPARKYHDAEKEQAITLTQIAVDSFHEIWMLRNESGWYLKSVSFECDTNDSSDERFSYARGDGSLIQPWHDKHNPRGKKDPWGVGFPNDGEVVRHISGLRQDLLDSEATSWYLQKARIFNCRVTDVDLDHRELPKVKR